MAVLAIDIGGTFTDAVLSSERGLHTVKVLTTPQDPSIGFAEAAAQVLTAGSISGSEIERVVHATTLATNVILEQRGPRLALVTTDGYRSLLALGRHGRVEEERYDLWSAAPSPVIALEDTYEVRGRLAADGTELVAFDREHARSVAKAITGSGVTGVVVCFLNSYLSAEHEQAMAAVLREECELPVTLSSDVLPELREFDRMTTTVMSAYVRPVMTDYLQRVAAALTALDVRAPVHIMASSGGVLPVALAAEVPVHTIESGPAAGVIAAAEAGRRAGTAPVLAFDMGGTTAKTAVVIDAQPVLRHDFIVGGKGSYGGRRAGSGVPIKIPAIDLAEVGSGGGSIAWLDASGGLRVGPHSAGADPGPACYGRGGELPTVTDANLALGYLGAERFAGGSMRLDVAAAENALATLAQPLGVTVVELAERIHSIANLGMAAAVQVVTVQRGIDPREFVLVATGGAAPMHCAALADHFGIAHVLVPTRAGVGSAVGLTACDLTTSRSRTSVVALDAADADSIEARYVELAALARRDLDLADAVVRRSAAMRYVGQAHEIEVDVPAEFVTRGVLERVQEEFYAKYRRLFGIDSRRPTQIVSLRVWATAPAVKRDARLVPASASASNQRRVWFAGSAHLVDVVARDGFDGEREGPLVIEDDDTTVVVPPGWSVRRIDDGSLSLRRSPT